ncbi:MAG: hypothetical protein Q9168_000183 [Polycauliona sp. 1 TL-2023]
MSDKASNSFAAAKRHEAIIDILKLLKPEFKDTHRLQRYAKYIDKLYEGHPLTKEDLHQLQRHLQDSLQDSERSVNIEGESYPAAYHHERRHNLLAEADLQPQKPAVLGSEKETLEPIVPSSRVPTLLIGHTHNVYALDVSQDGTYVVSGSWDSSAKPLFSAVLNETDMMPSLMIPQELKCFAQPMQLNLYNLWRAARLVDLWDEFKGVCKLLWRIAVFREVRIYNGTLKLSAEEAGDKDHLCWIYKACKRLKSAEQSHIEYVKRAKSRPPLMPDSTAAIGAW